MHSMRWATWFTWICLRWMTRWKLANSLVNEALEDAPELINQDAFENWIIKVQLTDATELDNLMDAAAYKALTENA